MDKLKIIPYYTGIKDINETLKNEKALNLLWLEILFNDSIDWEKYSTIKDVKESYEKACNWYSNYKTLVENYAHRKPLKVSKSSIDQKEYRKFIEALNFVSS